MNWIQQILKDDECPKCGQKIQLDDECSKCGQTKLLQTKIDRKLADDFKVMCVRLGRTQRQVIEDWMGYMLEQYEVSGNLTPAGEAHG